MSKSITEYFDNKRDFYRRTIKDAERDLLIVLHFENFCPEIPTPDSFWVSKWNDERTNIYMMYYPSSSEEAKEIRKKLSSAFNLVKWERDKTTTNDKEIPKLVIDFKFHLYDVQITINNADLAPGCKIEETEETRLVTVRRIICPEGKETEQETAKLVN